MEQFKHIIMIVVLLKDRKLIYIQRLNIRVDWGINYVATPRVTSIKQDIIVIARSDTNERIVPIMVSIQHNWFDDKAV